MAEKIYPIYHEDDCKEVGMYTSVENPQLGENMIAGEFFKLDKTEFLVGELAICGHCGRPFMTNGCLPISWIDYENPVEVERHGS